MKTVLITGVSSQSGEAIAPFLVQSGYRVIGTYASEPLLFEHPQFIQILWKKGDIHLSNQLSERLMECGVLHGWIHLIGGFMVGYAMEDTSIEKIKHQLDLNLLSAVELTPLIFSCFSSDQPGSVIFMGGEPGLNPVTSMGAYGLSKSALIYFAESLALENKNSSARVNVIIPSALDTETNRKALSTKPDSSWISLQDLSETILFLLSDHSRKVNGSLIRLN